MTQNREEQIEQILQSDQAKEWTEDLVASFFDADAKRQIIRQAREAVADQCSGMNSEQIEKVQQAIVAQLIGLASRDAAPPKTKVGTTSQLLSGPALEDEIVDHYPHPIAVPYFALADSIPSAGAFGSLLDTFESLIHYLATVAVSAYLRSGMDAPACNRHLLEILVKNAWSTGDLYSLLLHPVRAAGDCAGHLPYATLPAYLFKPNGKPTASNQVLQSFITLRNRAWGHGTGRDDAFFSSILGPNRSRLDEQLACLHCLTGWELVRPIKIDDSGVVRLIDRLMSRTRRRNREYALRLDAEDLPQNGGDVRAEKSVLLVSPDRSRYLPLYPLSLFGFNLRSQGVYFLQRPQWEKHQQRHRLTKACYVAYESDLQEHEEGPGEPVARSLERIVGALETGTDQGVVIETRAAGAMAEEDPDVELREVVHEQKFHLRSFAGRQLVLKSYRDWIETSDEGGYLLLLGPPGQGKSAVMAQLAHEEAENGCCLLHMVKSHRNPRRFLPSLIRQAARILGTRFGETAYQGDIDDLRDSLLKAVEALIERFGRAVIVLDALDELESSDERIGFLPPTPPAGMRVILTCRPDIPLLREIRSRLCRLEEWELPPLLVEELPALLQRRFKVDQSHKFANIVNWRDLFQRLQGNPLFLRRALDRIERTVQEAQAAKAPPRIEVDTLPASLDDLFQDIYSEIADRRDGKYASDHGRQRARLIQLLCVAREPLGFEQLAELLEADGQTISLEDCRDRVCEMSQYLLDVGGNRFKPWHQGLTDYIRKHLFGPTGIKEAEASFCRWLGSPSTPFRLYALRHYVSHLIDAARWNTVEQLLTDLSYLEAKAQVGLVFDLAGDFAVAIDMLPDNRPLRPILKLLEEALRRDIHFIARRAQDYPQGLFQCLWNHAWWYDCVEAAQHYVGGRPPGLLSAVSSEGVPASASGSTSDSRKVCQLLESWQKGKEQDSPDFSWLACLRPPPVHLDTPQMAVLRGHKKRVSSVSYSPDHTRIASGSWDGTIRVWDARSGAELIVSRGHESTVQSVSFSPDGARIASGSADRTVRVWDARSGEELAVFRGHDRAVRGVRYSPDGARIASGSDDATVREWDARSGAKLAMLCGHEGPVTSVAYFPDGARIASGSDDATVRVWETRGSTELAVLHGHESWVTSVSCSPDGARIASGSDDHTVRVWDARGGAELAVLCGHELGVPSVYYCPDGRRIASGSWDHTVRVWDARSGVELAVFRGHEETVESVCYSPDGARIASGSQDSTVRVWDGLSRAKLAMLRGHQGPVSSVSYSPDGMRIVSGGGFGDNTVRVWDARTGAELAVLRGHEDRIRSVSYSPEGARIASGSWDRTVRVWDAITGECLEVIRRDGDVATTTDNATKSIWRALVRDQETIVEDAVSGEIVARFPESLSNIVVHPSGRSWAGGVGSYLCILRLEGGETKAEG